MPTARGRSDDVIGVGPGMRQPEALLETGSLQLAILNSRTFSYIATDAGGIIQIFNVGADVVNPMKFNDFTEAVKQIGAFWGVIHELPPGNPERSAAVKAVPPPRTAEMSEAK